MKTAFDKSRKLLMVVREIINAKNRTYQPVGFIDDKPIN